MPGLPSRRQGTKVLQDNWAVDNASGLKMDPIFFMDFVIFRVEDCLFRLPRAYFENNSLYFKKMYLNPRYEGDIRGSSTVDPIILEDVKVAEFRHFLVFLYRPAVPRGESGLMLDAAIRLCTIWKFNKFRALAIGVLMQMDDMTPYALVCIGVTYTITVAVKRGLLGLVKNRTALDSDEQSLLELCGAAKGVERLRKGRGWRNASMHMICEEFKDFLGRIEREEEVYGVVGGESTIYVESEAGKGRGRGSVVFIT